MHQHVRPRRRLTAWPPRVALIHALAHSVAPINAEFDAGVARSARG